MENTTTYVGMDVHKKQIHVAVLTGRDMTPTVWQLPNEPRAIRNVVRKLEREAPGSVECCYEAGACGYALQRQLTTTRIRCRVIAPSLVPRKHGDRVKTDRRDARKLAELLRAGLLTDVQPPTEAEEAVRDLCRARDDAREDLMRCRHRLSKMLLRRGLHYSGKNWTRGHYTWIRSIHWEHAPEQLVIDSYLLAIEQTEARRAAFDADLLGVADTAPYREAVGWLRCFRGIDTLSAVMLLAELHDFRRFPTARALMAYIGVVPSERSSGDSTARGRITRMGNVLVRRLVTETAWHYQHRPSVSATLRRRRATQPSWVIAIADKAQQRLCGRFQRLAVRRKERNKIAVAVARELLGFIWAVLARAARAEAA